MSWTATLIISALLWCIVIPLAYYWEKTDTRKREARQREVMREAREEWDKMLRELNTKTTTKKEE